MGPDLPQRPKFAWDLKNAPWTDAIGPQEGYYEAVQLWKAFHDKLPDMNSNKIPADLQGIILQSELYGRAKDIRKKVPDATVQSANGAMAIATAMHRQDPLSVITEIYAKFSSVLQTVRRHSESFKNYESRFDAAVSSYNSAAPSSKLPDSLTAFILITNAGLENNQRISILSAAAPKSPSAETTIATAATTPSNVGDLLKKVCYVDVASILRSFDKPQGTTTAPPPSAIGANSAHHRPQNRPPSGKPRYRKPRTPEEYAELKKKTKCKDCQQRGHWSGDPECGYSSHDPKERRNHGDHKHPKALAKNSTATMKFMANLHTERPDQDECTVDHAAPGPLVDDGAPWSALGLEEFIKLQRTIMPTWDGTFDPLPNPIRARPYWQYGNGTHASQPRRILGSVVLTILSDQGTEINIRHLIIEGSSQWVIGRNVTRFGDIIHTNGNHLRFVQPETQEIITLRMIDADMHSYLPKEKFYHADYHSVRDPTVHALFASSASGTLTWKDVKHIIDRVHQHVCGHSNFFDISTLLKCNKLWSDECSRYLSEVLETCPNCHVVDAPSRNRRVSLSSMSRSFNDVVCIDHLHLGEHTVFHAMDSVTRYSVGAVVESTGLNYATEAMDSHWISAFWPPRAVKGDDAFGKTEFRNYLDALDIKFIPVPPRRHSKNAIESKHRIIRDIYLRLVQANPDVSTKLLVTHAIRISNDLYGNDVASANELAKGYTRPVVHGTLFHLPKEVKEAHDELLAKRKLTAILGSNSVKDRHVKVGDVVQVFIRRGNEKRGCWSEPKPVLRYDAPSQTVTVAGSKGKFVKAAIEDIRYAVSSTHDLASAVQKAIDDCNRVIEDTLDELDSDETTLNATRNKQVKFREPVADDASFEGVNEGYTTVEDSADNERNNDEDDDFFNPEQDEEPDNVGNPNSDDDFQDALTHIPDQPTHPMKLRERRDVVYSADVELVPGSNLQSTEQEDLNAYAERFKSKEFLLHQAQGLPTHIIQNAYDAEEAVFLKECSKIHKSKIPRNANVINSHVLYKIKDLDDGNKLCKARIAPHGNHDKERHTLKTDSSACPPLGFRVLLSICTMLHFFVSKVDVKSAFLQSGKANRDVYVRPPRECSDKSLYWLLDVATYGLVNANAKWQKHSDETLLELKLQPVVHIPQLFYVMDRGKLVLLLAKVVDDLLIGGRRKTVQQFIKRLSKVYKLGTIVHLPGSFRFFGLTVEQDEDGTIRINGEEKLQAIQPCHLSRLRRKDIHAALNSLELFSFQSVNGSLGFLGMTITPFAAFGASHLQQTSSAPTVQDLVQQRNLLKLIQRLGSVTTFKRPSSSGVHELAVLIFADAARPSQYGQLGFVGGLLIGDLQLGSVLHTVTWASHLSKRPVKSIGSAEVLAAGDAIDEGKIIAQTYSALLGLNVHLYVVVDSKDLWSSLSTCRTPEDKSILADVQLLRYNFETHQLNKLIWLPGKLNVADPLTKRDSPLCETLQLMLFDGTLPVDFSNTQARASNTSLGSSCFLLKRGGMSNLCSEWKSDFTTPCVLDKTCVGNRQNVMLAMGQPSTVEQASRLMIDTTFTTKLTCWKVKQYK